MVVGGGGGVSFSGVVDTVAGISSADPMFDLRKESGSGVES